MKLFLVALFCLNLAEINQNTNMLTLHEKIEHARSLSTQIGSPIRVKSIADLIQLNSSKSGVWLIYVDDSGKEFTLTYPDFLHRVNQTAAYFIEIGLKKGDRIATVAHNHWQTIILYFAAWQAGLTVVPVNLSEDNDRIAYIFQAGEVKRIFIFKSYINRISEIIQNLSLPIELDAFDENTRWESKSNPNIPEPAAQDDALIVFTSGTTGNPKAVLLTQQNLLEDAHAISRWHGIHSQTRMMCVLPIHHVNGTVVTHITPFYAGASVVLNQKFSVHSFFELIERHHVNVVSVVPTLLQYLNHQFENQRFQKPKSLKHIICGAGPLTVEVAAQFENLFDVRVIHGYGLSETTCYSCFLPIDLKKEDHIKWMRNFGYPSIGVAIPCNEMSIHDLSGNPVSEGERGEIVIRGSNVMKEYYANEQANENAFTHGWFRSGDEGFYLNNEQGKAFYFITGRIKELIIRGGVNLAPLEIDEIINKAPGVKAGISVGFENDWYGEEVGAYVQLKPNTMVTEEDILTFCKEHLPHAKTPKVIVFGNEIPVTSTGKYQRRKVAHLFKEWKSVQFKKN